jgi:hypothetical protein
MATFILSNRSHSGIARHAGVEKWQLAREQMKLQISEMQAKRRKLAFEAVGTTTPTALTTTTTTTATATPTALGSSTRTNPSCLSSGTESTDESD